MILDPVLPLGAALGGAVGSYVTTSALRATDEQAPSGARSACDRCRRPLTMLETIPVVSYLALRGRCRACRASITPFHPLGELAGAAGGLGVAASAADLRCIPLGVMAACLLAASVVDARTRRLPDILTLAVAGAGLSLAAGHGVDRVFAGVIAAAASGAIFLLLRKGSAALRGEVGLGLGDVKLFCALALWLGLATSWMVFAAAAIGLAAMLARGRRDGKIAFGPMIAVSGFSIGLAMEAGLWPELS